MLIGKLLPGSVALHAIAVVIFKKKNIKQQPKKNNNTAWVNTFKSNHTLYGAKNDLTYRRECNLNVSFPQFFRYTKKK